MPTSNFKLFDENKANMMDDSEYGTNQQRLNGVQTGVASSQLQNKTLYQVSLMSYALGQLMVQNGYDCSDTAAVTTFVNNLGSTFLQKVVDKASEEEAKAGVNNSKYITPATMKAALDVLSTDVDEKISDTKEYVDSKLVIPKLVFPGRTFKIVNTGKVSMDCTITFYGGGSDYNISKTVEFDCIVSGSGTFLYCTFPDIPVSWYVSTSARCYFYVTAKPTNGFIASPSITNVFYFTYIGQVLFYYGGGQVGYFSELPLLSATNIGVSENKFTGAIIFRNNQEARYSFSMTSSIDTIKSFGVFANFPGFLCLN